MFSEMSFKKKLGFLFLLLTWPDFRVPLAWSLLLIFQFLACVKFFCNLGKLRDHGVWFPSGKVSLLSMPGMSWLSDGGVMPTTNWKEETFAAFWCEKNLQDQAGSFCCTKIIGIMVTAE